MWSRWQNFGRARLDWLKAFLELPSGIPSHDTFNRVSAALDPHAFLACFAAWVEGICPNLSDEVVAIDGKALRRALNEGESIPYIVSAWASENGLALDRDLGGAGFCCPVGASPRSAKPTHESPNPHQSTNIK